MSVGPRSKKKISRDSKKRVFRKMRQSGRARRPRQMLCMTPVRKAGDDPNKEAEWYTYKPVRPLSSDEFYSRILDDEDILASGSSGASDESDYSTAESEEDDELNDESVDEESSEEELVDKLSKIAKPDPAKPTILAQASREKDPKKDEKIKKLRKKKSEKASSRQEGKTVGGATVVRKGKGKKKSASEKARKAERKKPRQETQRSGPRESEKAVNEKPAAQQKPQTKAELAGNKALMAWLDQVNKTMPK